MANFMFQDAINGQLKQYTEHINECPVHIWFTEKGQQIEYLDKK